MLNRAFSLLEIKQVEEDARQITGIATTPTPDRLQDVVEPEGAQFKLPIALLWQHDASQPIGHVTHAKVSKEGIEIVARMARILEPGRLKDRLDEAWQSIKAGLVSGLSIGFKALEAERIEKTNGLRFRKWEFLELSAVTIPANSQATITMIKNIDTAQRAALGRKPISLEQTPAGVSAPRQRAVSPEGNMQRTTAEMISAFETQRVGKMARMEEIQQLAITESRSKNEVERDDFDTLSRDIETIDEELKDLRRMESIKAASAVPVRAVSTSAEAAAQRGGIPVTSSIVVKTPPKLEPGIPMTRIWKVNLVSKLDHERRQDVAAAMYGSDSEVAAFYSKAPVPAGTTIPPNWASSLVAQESSAVADFAEFLRAGTILGRFGQGGVPSLRNIGFRQALITQTEGGAAYWVGESKAKPLTAGAFVRTSLPPTKVANICVLTEENIRESTPSSDAIVRDMLRAAIIEEEDVSFIDPANAGTVNVKPASITNGATTIASSGDDAAAIRLDVRSLMATFTAAHNPPSTGAWIMSSSSAMALGMMVNPLGQPEFPNVTLSGGSFQMMPIIVSDHVGDIVVLVNASDIFLARVDGIQVDMSREASLEMSDAPAHDSGTPTGAQLVSMFQTNSVAIRAEESIGWARRRDASVSYLTGVTWGGEVNTA
jgi:HK97 family phage major capsid protein/HK97 family phage prohead protease